MPVMEGKCVLFKAFGGVDAFPLCVRTQDVDEFVETVYRISGSFGAINLEDIAAPRCFAIERALKRRCDIPVFHDDQHGTAVTVLAGMLNALRAVGKRLDGARIVVNGAGAAGVAISHMLLEAGVGRADRVRPRRHPDGGLPRHDGRAGGAGPADKRERPYGPILRRRCAGRMRLSACRRGAGHGGIWCARWRLARSCSPRPIPCRRSCRRRRCAAARRWSPPGAATRPPDQQRPGVPRHLPRRAGRARARHQPAHASGGGAGAVRARLACGACRREDHPGTVRPARRPGRGGRRSPPPRGRAAWRACEAAAAQM